jgi:hypothetical protein
VKVLLDENLDHALRRLLGEHEVVTVTYMGWAGLKNGELLRAAEATNIDVLLTGDQTIVHEQNLTGRRIAIVPPISDQAADSATESSEDYRCYRRGGSRLLSGRGLRHIQPKAARNE